jgi:hypothetical protein
MRQKLVLALILCGLTSFAEQKLSAAQALAVASNGKWAVAWGYSPDVAAVSVKAMAETSWAGAAATADDSNRARTRA